MLFKNFFCSESKSFDDPKDFWNDFMAHARIVIDTLDRAGLGDNAGSPSSSVMTQSDNGDEEEKSGCKFLTSSQLFGLQCRDPQFRQQIAVQLLFFTHYFKYVVAYCSGCILLTCAVAHRVKLLPTIDGDKKVEYTKDIAFVESKAEALVSTPSTTRSRDLLQTVQRILDRESHWIKWKAASCPPFERSPVSGGESNLLVLISLSSQ